MLYRSVALHVGTFCNYLTKRANQIVPTELIPDNSDNYDSIQSSGTMRFANNNIRTRVKRSNVVFKARSHHCELS